MFEWHIILAMALGGLLGIVIIVALLRYLWNATMPEVFGVRPLSYAHAFRLLLISAMLFGWPLAG